jgi:ribosomal protein S18 acetylase RimI-like enzyme
MKKTSPSRPRLIIREASVEEVRHIIANEEQFGLAPVENIAKDERFRTFVGKIGGKIVGFVEVAIHYDDQYAEIMKLAVHKDMRCRGIAKDLLGMAGRVIMKTPNIHTVMLSARGEAIPFYEKTHYNRLPKSDQFMWAVKRGRKPLRKR